MSDSENQQLSIKSLRINEGLTQEALAQKLGIDRRQIINWENNKAEIKPMHIYALAYLFKVDSDIIRV